MKNSTTIYLVRHGKYENPNNLVPFRMDGFPLSEEGRNTISKLIDYFKDKVITTMFNSPILRTKQTAEILMKGLGINSITSELLIETGTPYQGYDMDKFKAIMSDLGPFDLSHHQENGGESIEDIFNRVDKLVKRILIENKGENVILVSHGDPIMIYSGVMMGKDFDKVWSERTYVPMGGLIRLEFDENGKILSVAQENY